MQRGLNKLLGQRRFRMREHFADAVFFNQLTLADNRNLIADAFHHVHFMGDQQDGQAETTINVFQQFQN
ncbi:hypothetical protein D3C80_1559970 [compost metagenome]